MSKLKAIRVNWIRKAWEVHDVIADINRLAGNALSTEYLAAPDLPASKVAALESLQDALAKHLAYRMSLQKVRLRPPKGSRWAFTSRLPAITLAQRDYLADVVGMDFSGPEQFAVEAHVLIGSTLASRWIADEDKCTLPLLVASIPALVAGVPGKNRGAPRPNSKSKKSTLRLETELAVRNHPGETAFEILNRLAGGVVESSNSNQVSYWSAPGKLKKITLDRFENIFSEANAAVRAADAAGKRLRRPSTG